MATSQSGHASRPKSHPVQQAQSEMLRTVPSGDNNTGPRGVGKKQQEGGGAAWPGGKGEQPRQQAHGAESQPVTPVPVLGTQASTRQTSPPRGSKERELGVT